jgi:hypothetical protein
LFIFIFISDHKLIPAKMDFDRIQNVEFKEAFNDFDKVSEFNVSDCFHLGWKWSNLFQGAAWCDESNGTKLYRR